MYKTRIGILTLAVLAIATLGVSVSSARADGTTPVSDTQKSNYIPNANVAGANQVNVTDTFERTGTGQAEIICAGFYVFDENEALQECCGCPISEDGLLTITVDSAVAGAGNPANGVVASGDLVSNPFTARNGARVLPFANVKIVSFTPNQPSQLAGQDPLLCDATGGTYPEGQYPFPILSGFNNTHVNAAELTLTPSLRAWATHLQNQTNLTESEFRDVPLSNTDADNYAEWCGDIQQIGSGRGVCSCGNDAGI